MQRTNIYLDEDQLRALKYLAAEKRQSVAVLVRQAINAYLVQNFCQTDDWGERFDALVARIRSRIPAGVSPDQIETDVTAAREEVRQAHRAARSSVIDASGR